LAEETVKREMLESLKSGDEVSVIKDFKSSEKENEILFFLKPEFFRVKNSNFLNGLLSFILKKISEFSMDIAGIAVLNGLFLKKSGIIQRHYGFINRFSMNGSVLAGDIYKAKIREALSIKDIDNYKILGGHEALEHYNNIDEDMLDKMWYTKNSTRIGEGFYIQHHIIGDENVILINGFHPRQIKHYTGSESRIVLFLLQTDTDWTKVRNNFVGDTYPENAAQGSIRATLLKNPLKYGIGCVSVANNFVHSSSGPFDALFEICNFVGSIKDIGFCKKDTNIYNLMKSKYGLDDKDFENSLSNPSAEIGDMKADLFTFTKNKNTNAAVTDYIRYFRTCSEKTVFIKTEK